MEKLLSRMLSAMSVRGLSEHTHESYLRHVRQLGEHFGRSADEVRPEEIELYLLHLKALGRAPSTRNQCAAALRFLYLSVLRRPEYIGAIPKAKPQKRQTAILSGREVLMVLEALPSIKHQALAMCCYGAGLRIGEACRLRIEDIDSQRMMLHVRNGKGQKDRQVKLSPRLLQMLRQHFKRSRPSGAYLFEGRDGTTHITKNAFRKALIQAVETAGIRKRVTPHVFRHSYATHMVEAGGDLHLVQLQLGHGSIRTTVRYVHLANARRKDLPTPLDMLGTEQGSVFG